ncbi:hypothetical protein [Streptomyces sp. NBC_00859]|uniref:hypothetical protein n=1 Tax=Streptomyces sp. NBC_00859 TaxID=2903682 RepID=UPI00386D7D16|nr:hypothetical protein OG584_09170 [Streptomyces sp. NBC_00859]
MYEIYSPLIEASGKETGSEFLQSLKLELADAGWDLRPSGRNVYSSTVRDVKLVLVPLKREAGQKPGASLWARSGCTDVGDAKKEVLRDYGSQSSDPYDPKDASKSPVPTGFPDPDHLERAR